MAMEINQDNFDTEVLQASVPVLVDFWAPWCGPCRALAPTLDDISKTLGAKAKIVKVNVDESPDIAQTYGIRSIPTLIFFKEGQVYKTLVGAQSRPEIIKSLEELM